MWLTYCIKVSLLFCGIIWLHDICLIVRVETYLIAVGSFSQPGEKYEKRVTSKLRRRDC